MSREALLEKIKKAEAAAASDIEAAEREQVSARNKLPIDQDNLLKKAKDSAMSKSQKEIDAATSDVESQKSDILKKGKKSNSDMKKKAEGKVDAVIEANLKPYDILPLIPIIKNSGAIVTNWKNEPAENGGNILATSNKILHNKILNLLKPFARK